MKIMVALGHESVCVYNSLGCLIDNEIAIIRNAYGYAGVPSAPTALNPNPGQQTQVVRKDYVLDYASPLKSVIMETEAIGLTYRHTYGAH